MLHTWATESTHPYWASKVPCSSCTGMARNAALRRCGKSLGEMRWFSVAMWHKIMVEGIYEKYMYLKWVLHTDIYGYWSFKMRNTTNTLSKSNFLFDHGLPERLGVYSALLASKNEACKISGAPELALPPLPTQQLRHLTKMEPAAWTNILRQLLYCWWFSKNCMFKFTLRMEHVGAYPIASHCHFHTDPACEMMTLGISWHHFGCSKFPGERQLLVLFQ